MNSDMDDELIRELQSLPELAAPRGFLERTMSALEQPTPSRVRPWAKWPLSWRIAFLVISTAVVTAVVGGWWTVEPGLLASAGHRLAPLGRNILSGWDVLSGVASALMLAAQHLGTGFLVGCFAVAAGACAVCAGFGTIFVRFALMKPRKN